MAYVLRPTNLFVALAVIVVAGSALFADAQNRTLQDQQLRAQVARQLSVLRARLEGNINGNLQLVRGLVATLATEPQMSQALEPARRRALPPAVAIAQHRRRPDFKVSLIYPSPATRPRSGSTTPPIPRSGPWPSAPAIPGSWCSPARSI